MIKDIKFNKIVKNLSNLDFMIIDNYEFYFPLCNMEINHELFSSVKSIKLSCDDDRNYLMLNSIIENNYKIPLNIINTMSLISKEGTCYPVLYDSKIEKLSNSINSLTVSLDKLNNNIPLELHSEYEKVFNNLETVLRDLDDIKSFASEDDEIGYSMRKLLHYLTTTHNLYVSDLPETFENDTVFKLDNLDMIKTVNNLIKIFGVNVHEENKV